MPSASKDNLGLALRKACRAGHWSVAASLLVAGAPADEPLRGHWRATALGWAVAKGSASTAKALVEAGADPWAPASAGYSSAWMDAFRAKNTDVIRSMAEAARPWFGSKSCPCPMVILCRIFGGPFMSSEEAAVDAARALLPICDKEALDGWGMTPLMHATRG